MRLQIILPTTLIWCTIFDRVASQVDFTFSKGKGGDCSKGKGYNCGGTPPAPAPAPPPPAAQIPCYSPHGLCKQCSYTSSGCKLRVDVECSYTDSGGILRSCVGPQVSQGSPPEYDAFLTVDKDACKRDATLAATIKYRMCNFNDAVFIPNFMDNYIRYKGVSVQPGNWDSRIAAQACREFIISRQIDPCLDPFQAGIVVSMVGNLDKTGYPYCRCFNKVVSKAFVDNTSLNTTAPTPFVTDDPTEAPTPSPTLAPTDAAPLCKMEDVVITELANPEESYAKYIELFFLDQACHGLTITSDLKIIRYNPGQIEPTNAVVDLKGVTIRSDGFVSICNSFNANLYYGRFACTKVDSLTSPANLAGIESIALIEGDIGSKTLIDVFGIPGTPPGQSNQYFVDGRAVRKVSVTSPSKYYIADDWYVFPGVCKQKVGYEGMDINVWEDVQGPICPPEATILITEIVDLDDGSYPVPRYVELYTPKLGQRGMGFNHDLKLVIFHSDFPEPNWDTAIPISYMPESGFLLICNKAAYDVYGHECAETSFDIAGPANSNGNDQIALISGDADGWFVVDIYGVIGEDGFDTDHYFKDARVIRKLSVTETVATWDKNDWQVCPSDNPDPNLWDSDVCGEAPGGPTPSPTSAPTDSSQKDCEFFFTELADCDDKPYIEIKSSCPGATISRDISVVSYKEYGASCEVDLKGVTVPDDGFIIICANKIQHSMKFGGNPVYRNGKWVDLSVCDIEDYMLLAGSGYNSYTILDKGFGCGGSNCVGSNCKIGCTDKFLDIYGYAYTSLVGTGHVYAGCRVIRKMDYPFGFSPFNAGFYEVVCPTHSVVPIPAESCDPRVWEEVPLVLFFTEFCDPVDDKNKRFIEMYSPNKKNYMIDEDLIVMKWEGSSAYPSYVFTSLKGKTINEDGYLVECINWYFWSADKCDLQTGYQSVANSKGDTHYAIGKCSYPSNNCEIVDVYGIPGTIGAGSPHDFRNGRVWRLDTTPAPQKIFDINNWVVQVIATADQCDPGQRPPPPLPSAPSPSHPSRPSRPSRPSYPVPSPHSGPSKGGKGKGKYWRN